MKCSVCMELALNDVRKITGNDKTEIKHFLQRELDNVPDAVTNYGVNHVCLVHFIYYTLGR